MRTIWRSRGTVAPSTATLLADPQYGNGPPTTQQRSNGAGRWHVVSRSIRALGGTGQRDRPGDRPDPTEDLVRRQQGRGPVEDGGRARRLPEGRPGEG